MFLGKLLVIVQVVDSACGSDTGRLWILHKEVSVQAGNSAY